MSEILVPDFGNPAEALLRWSWESVPGVPSATALTHDITHAGETLSNQLERLERTAIARGGLTLEGLPSKIRTGGDYLVDAINPESEWFPFAAMFRKAASPVAFEAGAYLHKLSVLETDVTFPETFSLFAWRQDGMAQRFASARFSAIEITFEESKLIGAKLTVVNLAGDYWSAPIALAGAGPLPQLRGVSELNFSPYLATDNVYLKITALDANTYTVKAKVGDATAYGGTTQVINKATWAWLRKETNARLGTRMSPVEVYMPTGMAVNDEIKFLRRRDQWVPSYVDRSLATREVSGRVLLDGTEYEIKTGKLTITRKGVDSTFGLGRRAPRRTRVRGNQDVTLTLNREYLDLDFRKRLELGSPFGARIELGTDVPLGATGEYDYSIAFICPRCLASGKTATAESRDKSDEALTFMAYPSADGTYPSDLTVEVRNDIPDLSAA